MAKKITGAIKLITHLKEKLHVKDEALSELLGLAPGTVRSYRLGLVKPSWTSLVAIKKFITKRKMELDLISYLE